METNSCACADEFSLSDAKKIKEPVIYALKLKSDGLIRYIGMTKSPWYRVKAYLHPGSCHNPQLAEWLMSNQQDVRFVVLERSPADLSSSERNWIEKIGREHLFNLTDGGEEAWMKHVSKPWMAGRGIKCPSDILIMRLYEHAKNSKSDSIDLIKKKRKGMTIKDRCYFEINLMLYLGSNGELKSSFDKWMSLVYKKIVPYFKEELSMVGMAGAENA